MAADEEAAQRVLDKTSAQREWEKLEAGWALPAVDLVSKMLENLGTLKDMCRVCIDRCNEVSLQLVREGSSRVRTDDAHQGSIEALRGEFNLLRQGLDNLMQTDVDLERRIESFEKAL